jgi:[ribosomal protein S18]-alanine N-acetyltransferase
MRETLRFTPMDEANARRFVRWQYQPPYDLYNMAETPEAVEAAVSYFLDPAIHCTAITDEAGDLLAFCTFGRDGQVAGGDYSAEALDIGMGIRPDLTGQGLGGRFAQAVLDFARYTFHPPAFRVTIAGFNRRAQRVWQKAGFRPVETFEALHNGRSFTIFVRER